VTILVQDATKLVRIAPGQKDLKNAAPIQLQDVQVGDRILVRAKLADDGKSVLAASVNAIKRTFSKSKHVTAKKWQKHGCRRSSQQRGSGHKSIIVSLPAIGEKKDPRSISKDTVLRRYAPDSVNSTNAKARPLDQIKPGDQLRSVARAT